MGIGQPGVEGPDRHFNAEGDEEADESQRFDRADVDAEQRLALTEKGPGFDERCHTESTSRPADQLRRQQHAERAAERIDHELGGGVEAAAELDAGLWHAAPLIDEEVHRHKRQFIEEEEDHQIHGCEDAHAARLKKEQQRQVHIRAIFDIPACEDRQRRQNAG